MATERKLVEPRHGLNTGLQPASLSNMEKQDKAPENECSLSCTSSSTCSLTNTTSGGNNVSRLDSIVESGREGTNSKVYGNTSTYGRNNSKTLAKGLRSDNNSGTCCINSYNRYPSGSMMGVDGNCIGPNHNDSVVAPPFSLRSRQINSLKKSSSVDSKAPLNSTSFLSSPLSNFPRYSLQDQHFNSSNKVPQLGSDFHAIALSKGSYYARNLSLPSNQVQGLSPNGRSSFRQNGTSFDVYKTGEISYKSSNYETSKEFARGPRSLGVHTVSNTLDGKEWLGPRVRRDRYNRSDFQIKYDDAKFFIIKSYSEDDIHKSIKYDVWSSTPNGNRKLNAAFLDAEARYTEKGSKCPVFLFFSVNGSGQFLGLAEMIGPVDFEKDMDFWQQDKWSGFFPVTWHIVKDIPNNRLRHIILENNDNKAVTYTRDTQEVFLKQGLEMLSIFKNFQPTTSMLDDYKFYEEQEKLLQLRKSKKKESPDYDNYRADFREWNFEAGARRAEQVKMKARSVPDSFTSLANLARNLSLNDKNTNARKG